MSDLRVIPEDIPTWLDEDFFRKNLLISGSVKIISVEYACAKGDNFASKIYRVALCVDDNMTSLVVKSRPMEGGFSEEFTKKFNVFPKETEMYEHVDRFERLFRNAGRDIKFAPRCLKVTNEPTDILIIEDLNAKGFKMLKKSEGLQTQEMEMALKKLAQFHAASAAYYEVNGAYEDKFSRGIYNIEMKEIFDQNYDFNFSFIVDECLSTWPQLDKKIISKMKNWREYILNELIRTMTPKPNQFNCLNHGDAWLANFLFQYDSDGKLNDCQFIDFQQSVFTSPAVDLLVVIFTSADRNTNLQNFEKFVKFYHGHLVETLKLLKYSGKIPTLKELYLDILDRAFLAVWNGIAVLPSCLVENVQESSSDNLLGDTEVGKNYKMKLFNNDRYRKHLTDLLTYFDQRGLVELC